MVVHPSLGVLSRYLRAAGIDWNPLLDGNQAAALIIVAAAWKQISYNFLFFLAGLQSIPKSVLEAAAIDGARSWRVFKDVTFPVLRPILLILTSLSIIWDFGVFTQPYLLIGASNVDSTNYVMGVYVFIEGYAKSNFGRGAAISLLMLVMVAAMSIFYVRQMVRTGRSG